MHSGFVSAPGMASAGTGSAYGEQDDSREGDFRGGVTKRTGFPFVAAAIGVGAVVGTIYLLNRVIRGLQSSQATYSQQHPREERTRVPTDGVAPDNNSGLSRGSNRGLNSYLPTVGHFSRLRGERWAKFCTGVIDNLRLLDFTVADSRDIFAGMSQAEIRQRINSKFKKISLLVHPDKCGGRDDRFKMVLGAREYLLQRLLE